MFKFKLHKGDPKYVTVNNYKPIDLMGEDWPAFKEHLERDAADSKALQRVRELAKKFEAEGEGETLLYSLAASRIRAALKGTE